MVVCYIVFPAWEEVRNESDISNNVLLLGFASHCDRNHYNGKW